MTIIQRSLSILREISVGDNQPSVRFASPETPGTNSDGQNWQRRGYLGDYPLDRGGMSQSSQQWQPWFVVADPETGNPEREKILYQVRRPRGLLRRASDKTFILGGFGNSETYFIGHHQLQGYVEEPSLPGDFEVAVSGGYKMKKISGYVLHGYPGPRLYPSASTFSTYDGGGIVMQYRCIPANPATDGYPWATQTAQFNCGIDNYIGGDAKENGHSRFTRITNRWQVGIMAGVQHPSMTQPAGIGYADFLNSVFPWDTALPDEEIWLERGAYDSGPDTQQLVLKRSAPLSSTKVYTLTKLKGEFSATPATVTMAAGSSSVQFVVTVPASPGTAQQVLYITDGSTEDHWGDFVIGNGSSTGDTGGDSKALGNLIMIGDSLFRGDTGNSPPIYAPADELKSLLNAGGYTSAFVGDYSSSPGSHSVTAVGGWKVADVVSATSAIAAKSPKTLILSIGTNNLGSDFANIATNITNCLNGIASAIGGLSGRRFYVCAPVELGYFDDTAFDALRDAMDDWCDAGEGRYFLDFNDAGMDIGGADGNGDGTHWSSAGADKIAAFIYAAIDGGPPIPGNPTGDYSRTNLLLESDDVRETPEWDLQSGSSNAPDGGGWQTITNGTGEIRQTVAGFTAGEPSTFSVELDPDSTDWVLLRISDDTYAIGGCHQFVNVTTGALGSGTTYGAATNLSCVTVAPIPGGSGGIQAKLTVTLPSTSRIAMARAASADLAWDQEPGLTFQARYWQFQSGSKGTNHIPTNATAVTRTLTTATITGTASTPVAPALTGTLTLVDNASQPWDQFSDITITSSNPSVVSVTQATGETNYLGAVTFQYTPLANGSANITAVAGDVTSNTFAVTVSGTAVTVDAPAAPVVTVSNSDTVAISVGSIDSDATHVVIEAKIQNPDDGGQLPVYVEVANLAKASLPVTVTDLTPGKQYKFRARAYVGSTYSSYSSESALVTLKRLMVEGYVSTRALNQSGVDVQVFRPPTGLWDALPLGESLGSWTGQAFSSVSVVVTGRNGPVEQAPIRVVMTRHPTTGKLRHGDRLSMIAVLDDPRTVSQPISNARVVEDV